MTSILERLDDLIRGSLHRFVDRALESNSLLLYDQDVRDMASAIHHLEEATTGMYAAALANERRLGRHREDVERLEQRLAHLVEEEAEPTSERMMVALAEHEAKKGLVTETEVQIERQQAQYETLAKTLAETKVRAETLQDTRPRLESLLVLARAYRSVEQVELTLDALRGVGGDTEVALVADSIYQRFGEAQARIDLINQAADLEILVELERDQVEDQLDARRRRLGLESELEEVEMPPATATPTSPTPEDTKPSEDGPQTPSEPATDDPPLTVE